MNAHNYLQYKNLLEALKTDPHLDPLNHLSLTRAYDQQGLLLRVVLTKNDELARENQALRKKLENCRCQTETPAVDTHINLNLSMPDLTATDLELYIIEADTMNPILNTPPHNENTPTPVTAQALWFHLPSIRRSL